MYNWNGLILAFTIVCSISFNHPKSDFEIASHVISKVKRSKIHTQPAFTCSKLTIETLEQGVKYVQS